MYDNRKTPHCREIGGLRKGATGLFLDVKSQSRASNPGVFDRLAIAKQFCFPYT
jgi:hypothetical protein